MQLVPPEGDGFKILRVKNLRWWGLVLIISHLTVLRMLALKGTGLRKLQPLHVGR